MNRQNKLRLYYIKDFITDLFFPNRCPVCGCIIESNRLVCSECENKLEALRSDDERLIERCQCSFGISIYYYAKEAKQGIISLKERNLNFGRHLGRELAVKAAAYDITAKADMVTYVPMSRRKLRIRGYNQAKVIAGELSLFTGIPLKDNILFRRDSEEQHTLGKADRMKNVSAFYCDEKTDLSGKSIIICDDVITTGSTLQRCAELLKKLNAADIYIAAGTTTKYIKE